MTKVVFLLEVGSKTDVFAYFPDLIEGQDLRQSYSHVGQHSPCHIEYSKTCAQASQEQYADLAEELNSIGYELEILNQNTDASKELITCWRNPTAYEIKFGEGATHYRDFSAVEIGRNKTGELKNWFKAEDGLRYNRY